MHSVIVGTRCKEKYVVLQQMGKVSIMELEVEYGLCYSKSVKRNF